MPDWVRMGKARRAHVERVSALMDEWGAAIGLSDEDRTRWRAAARLHDALKQVSPSKLQPLVHADDWPDPVVHGPACAARLTEEGVEDHSLLAAIMHHSTGHPDLDDLGRHLYLADYLEPGRRGKRRAKLRGKMPRKYHRVLRDVATYRIKALLNNDLPIRPATLEFWNELVSGG